MKKVLLINKTKGPDYSFLVVREDIPKIQDHYHYHPEYELKLVLKGNGTRIVGNNIAPFGEGDLCLLGPELPHVWKAEKVQEQSYTSINIHFDENFMGPEFFEKPELIKIKKTLSDAWKGIEVIGSEKERVSTILQTIGDMSNTDRMISFLKVLNLISNSKYQLLSPNRSEHIHVDINTSRIKDIHRYLLSNFKDHISLEEIAQISNMTPTSFCRYFKQHTNKTFTRFLNEIRINHACHLLEERKMKILEVCFESGFTNLSNFNKQFKSIMNIVPKEYAKRINTI